MPRTARERLRQRLGPADTLDDPERSIDDLDDPFGSMPPSDPRTSSSSGGGLPASGDPNGAPEGFSLNFQQMAFMQSFGGALMANPSMSIEDVRDGLRVAADLGIPFAFWAKLPSALRKAADLLQGAIDEVEAKS